MSGTLSEDQINNLVTDLVDKIKQDSKEESTTTDTSPPKSEQVQEKSEPQQSDASKPTIQQLLGGLFTNVVKTLIPPELKKNKEMDKMLSMIMSTFTSEHETTKSSSGESNSSLNKDCGVEYEKDTSEEDEEEDDDTTTDEDDDTEHVEDSDDITESSGNEYEKEGTIYIITRDMVCLGYTSSSDEAEKYMVDLYKNFIFNHTDQFFRTEKTKRSITLYERNPHLLFAFREHICVQFEIIKLHRM